MSCSAISDTVLSFNRYSADQSIGPDVEELVVLYLSIKCVIHTTVPSGQCMGRPIGPFFYPCRSTFQASQLGDLQTIQDDPTTD